MYVVIAIDTSPGAPTVSGVEKVTLPKVALIVTVPLPALVANPVALMIATAAEDVFHCAAEVKSCTVPSLKVPVAVNCCVVPRGMDGLCGLIAIDTSTAGLTTRLAEVVTPPAVTEIVLDPVATEAARPCVGAESLIVATATFDEVQYADCVTSCVVLSL